MYGHIRCRKPVLERIGEYKLHAAVELSAVECDRYGLSASYHHCPQVSELGYVESWLFELNGVQRHVVAAGLYSDRVGPFPVRTFIYDVSAGGGDCEYEVVGVRQIETAAGGFEQLSQTSAHVDVTVIGRQAKRNIRVSRRHLVLARGHRNHGHQEDESLQNSLCHSISF